MTKNPIPARCKGCRFLHTGGQKDGVHNRWCGQFNNAAARVQAQCVQSNGYQPRV